MERTTYSVIVSWREGRATVQSLNADLFARVRQSWIDEGYGNLQTEWYERNPEKPVVLDCFRVFAYWEDPDEAPSIDQLRAWGLEAPGLTVES
jgi:hypothetical protein